MVRTDGKCWRMFALERAARRACGAEEGGKMYLLTIVVITTIMRVSNQEVDQ
jgi:hypothetical protein